MTQEGVAVEVASEVQGNRPTGATMASHLDCSAEIPIARGDEVDTITELTLAEFIANGAVAGITIKETTEGFQVLVTVLWDESKELMLITQRTKQPKLWSSLNRLVQHLGRYPNLPTVKLEVRTNNAARKQTQRKKA